MEQLNIALAVIGLVVVLVGLFSSAIKQSPVQEPMIAVFVGIAMGPYGAGWLDLAQWGEETAILEQAARLTLAIGLMGVALRIDKKSVRTLWRPVGLLLTAGMLGMWLLSSALAGWLLGLALWPALLLGAIVTPTDPVVASSIVTGPFAKRHLPLRVRDAISMESGANDGLAYIFVMLPILMLQNPTANAWTEWLTEALLIGVVLAIAIGAAIGFLAARAIAFAERRKLVESQSLLGYTVAFSLFTLGAAALVGADALIAVFLAGFVFNMSSDRQEEHTEEKTQEVVAKLFTLPMFVIFGIALPLAHWWELGWPLLALAVLVLLLRRPAVLLALSPALRPLTFIDVGYMGWFGPIGVAAIYYAAFAEAQTHMPLLWHSASALIFASILVHGLTAAGFTRAYRAASSPEKR
jgi:NhaP-type Na+/H+ or K+/H+ antiporter